MKSPIKQFLQFTIQYNTAVIFLVMLIVSAFASDAFFTANNLSNLIRQVAPVGIISMGMLLVILTGGIDLSVGSVVALVGVLCALFTQTFALPVAVATSLLCGVVAGSLSGYLVSLQKMAPFIATLALMTIARGLGFIFSKGAPIMVDESATALTDFGSGSLLGIPNPAIILLLTFVVTWVLLNYNIYGRILIAIGSNEEAVRLSGVRVWAYKFSVYAVIGGLAAIAGFIGTARTGVGSPNLGVGLELDVIAAVVIGGTSLKGGKGSAVNTFLGVLILGMIGNIMNLMDVASYAQQVIKGLIIIFAVLLQRFEGK